MKIHIIAVGNKMPAWVEQGYSEYARRMPREFMPLLTELPLSNRAKKANVQVAKKNESKSILNAVKGLGGGCRIVALDVRGRSLSTESLAAKLQACQGSGQQLCLIIGGPDGLTDECTQYADERWSLSSLTLPHPLVRVVVIEQLYRAWTILQNHPYHK